MSGSGCSCQMTLMRLKASYHRTRSKPCSWKHLLALIIILAVLLQVYLLLHVADAKSIPLEVSGLAGNGTRQPFNLEETYNQKYRAFAFNGTWKSDSGILYMHGYTGDLLEYDVARDNVKVALDAAVAASYAQATVQFSHDDSYALIAYDVTAGFRHSTYKKYVVYDTRRKTYHPIANNVDIPLAKWSPTKNALAYVQDHDIYYIDLDQENKKVRRITNTGVYAIVYNGVPDWVYEEEVLGTASALWFSTDGKHLAFATFNDTEVYDAVFMYYGEPGSLEDQYTAEVKIKYPKAGTRNPDVYLSRIDLSDSSSKLVKLEAPVSVVGKDHILYTVTWWDDERVVATWANRVQNQSQMVLYDNEGVANNILYDEERDGWLRIQEAVFHEQYAIVLKLQESGTDAGKYLHATRFEYVDGKLTKETDLTPGASEVHAIQALDSARKKLYYLATAVDEPSQRNLYSVDLDGSNKPVCLSCSFITPEGNNCTYASALFSMNESFYVLSCSGPDPTVVAIFNTTSNKQLAIWEDNDLVRTKLSLRKQPLVKDLYVRANSFDSKVRLLLPPDFDETKKYPLLINVYAGPNTVRINEAASYGFQSYMTTNRSVIYGWIDGRGSAYRGSKMLFEMYRRMGTVEIEDQIAVTQALQETYPWIDANRTGIWGWSYGGFATAMVLATDKNSVFNCGISVAPVTSWIYYDSIYTERYMCLPTLEDNLVGYNASDVTRKVEGMRGKEYMLIHGTGDDNVHYQQAMELSKALVRKDIMFEQVSYADEAHGLNGVTAHLYHTMDRFWTNCFDLPRTH